MVLISRIGELHYHIQNLGYNLHIVRLCIYKASTRITSQIIKGMIKNNDHGRIRMAVLQTFTIKAYQIISNVCTRNRRNLV